MSRDKLNKEFLPQHIAIIMDGNGRWAKSRNLSRSQGHIEGMRRVEEIVDEAQLLGIRYMTLFTFSTENWSRPENEVSMLMNMLTTVLQKKIKKLKKNNIRFTTIGRHDRIPESVSNAINSVIEETKDNTGLVMNLAFDYGSRCEIIDAVKTITTKITQGELTVDQIDERLIGDHLYTHAMPDPDLLIRTSGEQRVSNFLLWQLSYAEFYFTTKFWPEFTIDEFYKALLDYQLRERRFGSVGSSP